MSHKEVKIRKPHRCFSCQRIYQPGATMIKWAHVYEGDFCHGYTCITCDKLMAMFPEPDGYPECWVALELSQGETPEDLLETAQKRRKEACPNNNPSS